MCLGQLLNIRQRSHLPRALSNAVRRRISELARDAASHATLRAMQGRATTTRVWEIDWAIPRSAGGTPWESYRWLLKFAAKNGFKEVSIVAANFGRIAELDHTLGRRVAAELHRAPHATTVKGITVRAVSMRSRWIAQGPTLLAWGKDETLAELERMHPPAIAAVVSWENRIPGWLTQHGPTRIGQVREEEERQHR